MIISPGGADMMKFKHYPLEQANKDFKSGRAKRYRVTTINWTYAKERGKVDHSKVHRNEYSWTLRHLVKFIRETQIVAEDVIDIQAEA